MRDGAARGRRPVLRAPVDEGLRQRLRPHPTRVASGPASTRSRARCSGRGPTSSPRSSRSAGSRPARRAALKRVVEGAFGHRRKTLANSLSLAGLVTRERAAEALAAIGRDAAVRAEALEPEEFVALAAALACDGRSAARRSTSRSSSGQCARTASTSSRRCSSASTWPTGSRVEPAERDRRRGVRGRHDRAHGARAARRRRTAGACTSRSTSRSRRPRRRQLRRGHRASARERTAATTRRHDSELHELAAQIGADVPFFLRDGPQLGSGDGSVLEPLELPQDFAVLLAPAGGRGEALDGGRLRGLRRTRRASGLRRASRGAALGARGRCAGRATSRAAAERPRLVRARRRAARAGRVPRRRQRCRPGRSTGCSTTARGAERAAAALAGLGRTWVTLPAWYG